MSFTVFPSLHLDRGQVVHLVEDQPVPEAVQTDAFEVALRFQGEGARWLHLVAVSAQPHDADFDLAERIISTLDIDVQALFCSVADQDTLHRALSTHCARLNLGSAALTDLDWCAEAIAEHGERLGVSTLVRPTPQGPRVATDGGEGDVGDLWEIIERLEHADCARLLVTDIGKEGSLAGPNLPLIEEVCARTVVPVLAAGGIRHLNDLRNIAALVPQGVAGAVVGRALYTGGLSLAEALSVAA
ncbi:HisA/HisF-related TIM barrel protein [Streptomyces kunmingensis]|uniref:HisA/HisF-related TIM barrel protein n=1 Tax=Streptomyces kunmingensis TaxID=68225 RepID=A0ABU6CFF2_9ACTN|nr:HisA/HisF-related TIM barrel protein [Streptomyces kunmingensis]MEB3963199.1 HisA/HisF-related TIM barrel protein [Streptomyces kunmingensis]